MRIERRYTKASVSPYDLIAWRKATSEIKNTDGSIVFRLEGIEVPESWSQVAVDVLAQKYFRKAGVPNILVKVEEEGVPTWLQRSVVAPYPIGQEDKYLSSEESAKQVFDRLADALKLNLGAAAREKSAFNLVRPDHKAENRVKKGGKKY